MDIIDHAPEGDRYFTQCSERTFVGDLSRRRTGTQDFSWHWDGTSRGPLLLECTRPGVFAIGDVRRGSTKRVAAAVGDGALVVRSIHASLASST